MNFKETLGKIYSIGKQAYKSAERELLKTKDDIDYLIGEYQSAAAKGKSMYNHAKAKAQQGVSQVKQYHQKAKTLENEIDQRLKPVLKELKGIESAIDALATDFMGAIKTWYTSPIQVMQPAFAGGYSTYTNYAVPNKYARNTNASQVAKEQVYEKNEEAVKTETVSANAIQEKNLENMIKEFEKNLSSSGYSAKIDIYDQTGSVKYTNSKKHDLKIGFSNVLESNKNKTLAATVAQMYNSGMNTKEIKKNTRAQGYDVKGYDDITSLVSQYLASGGEYSRTNYNSKIAEKIGADKKIIEEYLSGKGKSEIIQNFKKATGGMNLSKSTLRRIIKKHAAQNGQNKAIA